MEDKLIKSVKNTATSDIEDIKKDLSMLKDNVVGLAQDIRNGGGAIVREGLDQVRTTGEQKFHKIEEHIKSKPGQSLAVAFFSGLVFSLLLNRKH